MDEWLKKYAEIFGDGFPMIPLAWGRTDEEVIGMIKNCIDEGKDAYAMGLVEESDDIDY
jgi:hypothetical protein